MKTFPRPSGLAVAISFILLLGMASCSDDSSTADQDTAATASDAHEPDTPSDALDATVSADQHDGADIPSGDVSDATDTAEVAPPTGSMRFVHLAAGNGELTVSSMGEELGSVAFLQSTPYLELETGFVDLAFAEVGQAPLLASTQELAPDETFTVAIAGPSNKLDAISFLDLLEDVPTGHARLRVVQAALEESPLSFTLESTAGAMTLAPSLAYGETSDAVDVPVATYALVVDDAEGVGAAQTFDVPPLPPASASTLYLTLDQDGMRVMAVQLPGGSMVQLAAQ